MIARERAVAANERMLRFAERTGLTSDRPAQRYLWTDAFAVCNFLGLASATGEQRYAEYALHLSPTADDSRHIGRHATRAGPHGCATLIEGDRWATADPLGLGGLLMDACRAAQLPRAATLPAGDLLEPLLAAALDGLALYARQNELREPAARRLAYRELGLAIGIAAIERIEREAYGPAVRARLEALAPPVALGSAIEPYWRDARASSEPSIATSTR